MTSILQDIGGRNYECYLPMKYYSVTVGLGISYKYIFKNQKVTTRKFFKKYN